MKKNSLLYVLLALILCFVFLFAACDNKKDNANIDTAVYRTVSFDSRGGSEVKSQSVPSGNKAVCPEAPTNDGYIFLGWFKDEGTNEKWNFNSDTVNRDMTLYAGWQKETNLPDVSDEPKNLCEIYLTFGNTTVKVQLYDNATSRDLIARLPLTLEFSDYNNTEKIAYLPSGESALDTSDAPKSHTPKVGDLTVYAPWGNIAIFYKSFRASNGLAPFGKLDGDAVNQLSQINNGTSVILTLKSPEEETPKTPRILVAYFSATGTTRQVANAIKQNLNADIYEILPTVPYTPADLNYGNPDSRTSKENRDDACRPQISGSVEDLGQYDVIFIGYPIWHGKAPKIIYTFLESYDFAGKTVIPFCTSASSGIGSSATNLHRLAPDAVWKSGARVSGSNISALIEQMK